MAPLTAGRVVLLPEAVNVSLEAHIAAAARDVCRRRAVILDTEEGMNGGHVVLLLLWQKVYSNKKQQPDFNFLVRPQGGLQFQRPV